MKTLKKTLWILAITTVAVGALGWMGGAIALNSAPVKASVARSLQDAIKMPFALDSLEYSPAQGLKIRGARIDAPDQQSAPFLTTESVNVHARLLPLFERKLIIDEVAVANAALDWKQDASGRFVLPMLARVEKAQPAEAQPELRAEKPKSEPFAVEARRLRLLGARMIFRDNQGKTLAEFRGVNLTAKMAGKTSFGGKAEVAQVLGSDGNVILRDLVVPFSYTEEGLDVSGLAGTLAGGSLAGKFYVSTGEEGTPITVNAETEGVDVATLLSAAGNADVGLTGKLRGTFALSGKLNEAASHRGEANLEIEGGVLSQNAMLQAAGLLLGVEELISLPLTASRARLEIRGEEIRVRELTLQSERARMDVAGKIKIDRKLDLEARLSLAADLIGKMPSELARNFLPSAEQPGWSGVDFEIEGTLNKPKSNLEAKLLGGSLEKAVFDWLGLGGGRKADAEKKRNEGDAVTREIEQ